MKKIKLIEFTHARSGDKGDAANVGVIAFTRQGYTIIDKYLTVDRVKQYFDGICLGDVIRYELPNLNALNFILNNTLGGGGTVSTKLDAQGKTLASAILGLEIEIEDKELNLLTLESPEHD
ncbi:MAG: hypothetical protein HUU54_09155 [Ignavibacteriaceae bacterium]|nr:hypothetical protein [Ignavibacteriaceae bacterium]